MPPVDCRARPAVPAAGWRAAKVASRQILGLATPKLAGPTIRMPWRRQVPSSSARAGGELQPGRDHDQGLDSPLPAVLGDPEHGRWRCRDDRPGQRGRAAPAADGAAGTPFQFGRVRVDRVHRAREAAGDDVLPGGPGPPTRGARLAPMTATEAGASMGHVLATSADRSRTATVRSRCPASCPPRRRAAGR